MSVFNKNTMAVNVFVLKVFRFRLQILETAAALHALMVNSTCQGFFAQMNSAKEFCVGVVWFTAGAVAVAAGLSQAIWQASLWPNDRLVEKVSACRLLLMMSSLLICLWAEMKLNRKCFLSSYACECNHCMER